MDPQTARELAPELIGSEVNAVLQDRRVLRGRLVEASEAGLTLRDLRGRRHPVPWQELRELIWDVVAAF
ncbi:MAG: hypothetical protein N2561_06940 [Bacteroidetes bacterium]|nr:hypothetical protein [Rhodothermia bacterium]MCS7154972.1 hypothetical protein [Bacteroidota bacterium]MCX7907256.1 hypothetical protein [Bacteroidota bacterium]MDW8286130.1 hypothetical protein [Bacteroidota bacterium]